MTPVLWSSAAGAIVYRILPFAQTDGFNPAQHKFARSSCLSIRLTPTTTLSSWARCKTAMCMRSPTTKLILSYRSSKMIMSMSWSQQLVYSWTQSSRIWSSKLIGEWMEQAYQKTYVRPRTSAFNAGTVVITHCKWLLCKTNDLKYKYSERERERGSSGYTGAQWWNFLCKILQIYPISK